MVLPLHVDGMLGRSSELEEKLSGPWSTFS